MENYSFQEIFKNSFIAANNITGNISIIEIAERIQSLVSCKITTTPSNDPRSYRLCSQKLLDTGFTPSYSVAKAMEELCQAHSAGHLVDLPVCHNVKWMNKIFQY